MNALEICLYQVQVGVCPAHILHILERNEAPDAKAFMPSTSQRAAAIKALSLVADDENLLSRRFVVAVLCPDADPVMYAADLRSNSAEFLLEIDPNDEWDAEAPNGAATAPSDSDKFWIPSSSIVTVDDLPSDIAAIVNQLGNAVEAHITEAREERRKKDN